MGWGTRWGVGIQALGLKFILKKSWQQLQYSHCCQQLLLLAHEQQLISCGPPTKRLSQELISA